MSSGGFVTAPAESLGVCAGTSELRILSRRSTGLASRDGHAVLHNHVDHRLRDRSTGLAS